MKYLKEILIILLVVWVASKYIFDTPEIITETETVTVHDTTKVIIETKPEIKWVEKKVADTVEVNRLNSVIDSLQAEMNKMIDSTGQVGEYIAEQQTDVKDSTGNNIGNVDVKVISRIPLDPELKMITRATLINKTITNTTTIIKPKTFWQRFGVSAQLGAGMGLFTKQWDVYAGIGFHFEIM